ncbi:MAG: nitroreductase family protein [Acidimicrobiia bacterium]|nr:nitroreductase family protein [Acidimicrobiia bacterium]
MELLDALRGTGAVRDFTAESVDRATLWRILDVARFAPNGGNRQAWHVTVVEDPAQRAALRDLYVEPWSEYFAQVMAGVTPWSPLADRVAEEGIIDAARASGQGMETVRARVESTFAAPVQLVVHGDLHRLVATDRDLGHYTMVAGASIYPFVWNLLLAAREEGLGGVLTTMHARVEAQVNELVGAPEGLSLACVVLLGHPVHQPTRLRRESVESFTTVDRFDGPAFTA